jgi:Peroxiredoxin
MKTLFKLSCLLLLFAMLIGCNTSVNTNDYLKKVLNNLEKIESASYYQYTEVWNPWDTVAIASGHSFVKEYNNPSDTTIGASYVSLDDKDTTKFLFGYDGKIGVSAYHDNKIIVIDNFTARPFPFRPVGSPFFNHTKNIIRYALTTKDSITIDFVDNDDYYFFKLTINEDRQIEFFGKAYRMPDNSQFYGETTSIYKLWISKTDNLPYKLRQEMSHTIYEGTCSKVEFNKLSINDFDIYKYFPADYEIRKYRVGNGERKESGLIGKKAPDWVLNDKDEQSVSLSDFKGKVLLIQITGIGCGPCQVAIPALNRIKEKYSSDEFELLAIETWSRKPNSLKSYSNSKGLTYNILCGTDEIVKDYETGGTVPVIFILDKQQIVRKVINGYSEKTTENEILDAINECFK